MNDNMKKRLLLGFALWLLAFGAIAQVQPDDADYSVSIHAGYGHNLTYGSHANFDIDAFMPINQHFEMQANIRTSTANVHTMGVQLRPKFVLPIGDLYIEDRLMMRFAQRDNYCDFVHAISVG